MKANAPTGDDGRVVGRMRVVAPRRFDLDEPVAVHADAHLAIAAHTPERQVVQQLVGDDDMRRSAQGRAGAHAVDRGQAPNARRSSTSMAS